MSEPTPTPTPAPPPQIILQSPPTMFGRFGKLLLMLLGVAIVIIFSLAASYRSYFSAPDKPQERFHSLSRIATKKIAIIRVDGTILDAEDGFVKRQIDAVRDDSAVVGVVLRIDSPGGTVTGSDYLYHHLRKLVDDRKIPLVVSMGSICASGGYYIAMSVGDQPDTIFAEPTTWTGSIGVIIPHYDLSGLLGRWNVKDDSVASGPLKEMGSPTKAMTPEERKILQELVDQTFGGFKQIVTAGRPKFKDNPKDLDAIATGQIFTAKQALDHGLVDKIGFIEEAIERTAELANVSTSEVRCVRYEKPATFWASLLGGQSSAPAGLGIDTSALLDLAAPRAYYLWTMIPAVVSNGQND